MTDAIVVLAVLFAPVVIAVWLITGRRPVPPPITEADAEIFALEMALCGDDVDIAAAAKEGR